jgi:7,8-dihydropterin-6-yl-methyl-4-(beta-D-ribofuranosyl)aminobenzene 5'-phosphate synthase
MYTTGEMGSSIVEQSLVLDTDKGLVIITGCAHPGIINIVGRTQEILPDREIYLCMGGFHLSGSSPSELSSIIQGFREMGVHKVAPSHCSGDKCRELFEEDYQEDYIHSGVGREIVLSVNYS